MHSDDIGARGLARAQLAAGILHQTSAPRTCSHRHAAIWAAISVSGRLQADGEGLTAAETMRMARSEGPPTY